MNSHEAFIYPRKRRKAGRVSNDDAIEVYERLQSVGVKPSPGTVVAALKVCRSMRDLQLGKRIHRDVLETGDISNIVVANILLDLYAKTGDMINARGVFDSMKNHDIVSWNSIIQGYAQSGNGDLALELFTSMQSAGYSPNRVTVLAVLKACCSLAEKEAGEVIDGGMLVKSRCLETSREIHQKAAAFGFASDHFVANSLINLYAKCGNLAASRSVFDGMEYRSVVTWNCLIQGYASCGFATEALDLYAQMCCREIKPDAITFVAALKACCCLAEQEVGKLVDSGEVIKVHSLEKGKAIQLEAGDHCSNIQVANTLIDLYATCGSMKDSRRVFDSIGHPDVVSWNCLILGYAQNDQGKLALEEFSRMTAKPDRANILAALKACVSLAENEAGDRGLVKSQALREGKTVHSRALDLVHGSDLFVANALIDMYTKCGSMTDALLVFQDMKMRNVISWTCIILGYSYGGNSKMVLLSFQRMQEEGVAADHVTVTAALKAVAALAESEDCSVLKSKWLEKARAFHSQALEVCEQDNYLGGVLVDMYVKCGSMKDARQVFDSSKNPDLVLWRSMIVGYSHCGEPEIAVELYTRLLDDENLKPDKVIYVASLKACATLATLEVGQRIYYEVCMAGLDTDESVGSSLISFYGKCGSMAQAEEVFDAISDKTVVAWSALIAGYSNQGNSKRVFELFDAMQRERVLPDSVTLVSVLTACSHAGLVDKGREFFEAMSSKYGVTPNVNHYTCLVDLLCRANHLDEALQTVRSMPCEADAVLYTALLSSCLKWKNLEVGKMAFESVLRLDAGTGSAYSLMSNIYAGSLSAENLHQ